MPFQMEAMKIARVARLNPRHLTVSVAAAAPALFTLNSSGTGQAAAYNQDGSYAVNGPGSPIKIGSSILLYLTGAGQTNPSGADGQIATAPLAAPVLPVTATVGGVAAPVTYKGAIQGVLKTAAAVALFFPLVILAVPILDTGFVVAKRLKYGKPIYHADRWHFHHRFVNIGFSQRRTVLYLYAWTLCLAGMALALRFIPYSDGHENLNTGWTIVLGGIGVLVLIASFYLVIVLEILKLRRFSGRSLRRKGNVTTPEEVDADVAEQLATGEFPALDRD